VDNAKQSGVVDLLQRIRDGLATARRAQKHPVFARLRDMTIGSGRVAIRKLASRESPSETRPD
jgi:hypothetical protein